jgi:hypothetical protein
MRRYDSESGYWDQDNEAWDIAVRKKFHTPVKGTCVCPYCAATVDTLDGVIQYHTKVYEEGTGPDAGFSPHAYVDRLGGSRLLDCPGSLAIASHFEPKPVDNGPPKAHGTGLKRCRRAKCPNGVDPASRFKWCETCRSEWRAKYGGRHKRGDRTGEYARYKAKKGNRGIHSHKTKFGAKDPAA